MVSFGDDYFDEADFDAILSVIDGDVLKQNHEFSEELSDIVERNGSCFFCGMFFLRYLIEN